MAVFCNTPEQMEALKRMVGERDLQDEIQEIKQRIEYMEQAIIKKIWDKIHKDLLKNLESDISKMIVTQLNKELKKSKPKIRGIYEHYRNHRTQKKL